MKKLYLSILCATALTYGSNLALAGENEMLPPPPQAEHNINAPHDMKNHHKKITQKLEQELNLTDEQKQKAKELRKASRKKIKPLMDEIKVLHKKMDQIRENDMKNFEALLTKEQKEIFDQIKAKHKERHDKMKAFHHRHHEKKD